jgi:2-methylcitrate dehydratase PrpD
MDRETVRRFRPTGITGTIGAAVAGARMLGLSEDAVTSAAGFAANSTVGLNEWPASGADDMFFHAGFAARNAVTSVELAELGAYASEAALDGDAGLFAALDRRDRASQVRLFGSGELEILSVYHKPAPACNYAQTACQVARALSAQDGVKPEAIEAITVRVSTAALNYPGCNATGPFERVLQAKMSIQYCTAATLVTGAIEEANYRLLKDPAVLRLIGLISLEEGSEFTQAYPQKQGTQIIVRLRSGETVTRRMEDLVPADPAAIRARFRAACENADAMESAVDSLESQDDASILSTLTERREHASTHSR